MREPRLNLWTLGGLSVLDLLRRTIRASWHDEVFGQGGRIAFYEFLAMFPALLVLLSLSGYIPHLGGLVSDALRQVTHQVLPNQVSLLVQQTVGVLTTRPRSALQLLSVTAAALWAAHNATWAMIYGLNRAYEVEENRGWRKMTAVNAGLTFFLSVVGSMALMLVFCGHYVQAHMHGGMIWLRVAEWVVLLPVLSLSFAVLYRFAPNLRDHQWRWSTPGALCALVLWVGATVGTRIYFDHVNDYTRSYGNLNGVAMLLLWLYATNGAVLIGGEMNSEIEKAEARAGNAPKQDGARGGDYLG